MEWQLIDTDKVSKLKTNLEEFNVIQSDISERAKKEFDLALAQFNAAKTKFDAEKASIHAAANEELLVAADKYWENIWDILPSHSGRKDIALELRFSEHGIAFLKEIPQKPISPEVKAQAN